MELLRRSVLAIGLSWLSGCGFPMDREAELSALRDARPPFATFETLAYEKIGVPSETPFQIMRGSPVMDLEGSGRSFVKGFELPEGSAGLNIEVFSYLVRGGRAFRPMVTLLNAAREPLRVTKLSSVNVVRNPMPGTDWRLILLVQVQPEERVNVRYFVVHTSREAVELGFAAPDEPWMVAAGRGMIFVPIFMPSAPAPPPAVGSSPSGALSMTVSEMKR